MSNPLTIEVVVPVRVGERDRYPVRDPGNTVVTREVECPDGALSALWRDAWLKSMADVVVFKHDDCAIRDWPAYRTSISKTIERFPIVGVAGASSFDPNHPIWWERGESLHGRVLHVMEDQHGRVAASDYGPPGPALVLDGLCVAVARPPWQGAAGIFAEDEIARWWDEEHTNHFYDIAFSLNAVRAFADRGLKTPCAVVSAEILHHHAGSMQKSGDYTAAQRRFCGKYGHLPRLTCDADGTITWDENRSLPIEGSPRAPIPSGASETTAGSRASVSRSDVTPAETRAAVQAPATSIVIPVLGLYGSGTSMITRVLNLLGMQLGTTLLPPTVDNPHGCWENEFFIRTNAEMLDALGQNITGWAVTMNSAERPTRPPA